MNYEEYGDLYSRKEEALTTRSICLELKFNSKEDFVLMVFIFEITEVHVSQHNKNVKHKLSILEIENMTVSLSYQKKECYL